LTSAILLLPLWVACYERFLRIETPDYSERAWCRLEPLLSYVFQFADQHTIIHLDCKYSSMDSHHGREMRTLVLNAMEGKTTDQSDLAKIQPIVDFVKQSQKKVDFGVTSIKCFQF